MLRPIAINSSMQDENDCTLYRKYTDQTNNTINHVTQENID